MNRREFLYGAVVLGAAGAINLPNPPPEWNKPMIGISNYEGLCNKQMNLPEYIRKRGQEGYKFTRVFTDLGWGGSTGIIRPDRNIFLYEWNGTKYDQKKINKQFVSKLHESGRAAKESGYEGIILCLATNPKYWEKTVNKTGFMSFPWQLGFRDTRGFMQVADPYGKAKESDYPKELVQAWGKFTKYLEDLVKVCLDAPNPFMFRMVETYNELWRWGSVAETHPWIAEHLKKIRNNILFQFNPPLEELEEGAKAAGKEAFEWPLRLMGGYKGFKAHRLSFHGFYRGIEVAQTAKFLKNGGIDLKRVCLETDGATPNGSFTRENHTKHYLWRLQWRKTPQNVAKTISAHRDLIAGAKNSGVSLNIQDPIKWSLMNPDAANDKFWKEVAKEL